MAAPRTQVVFRHPAPFVPVSDDDGILSVNGAGWFVDLLRRVKGLTIREQLCQEDWGVVIFAEFTGKRYWVGLSAGPLEEKSWLAHFHSVFFIFTFWKAPRQRELDSLVREFHAVLATEPSVRQIRWSEEGDDFPEASEPIDS